MFKNLFGPTKIWWLLRQILQFGGMWIVASGYASQDEVNSATEALVTIFGAGGLLIGFAANIYSTFRGSVTVNGEKVPLPKLPSNVQQDVKVEAKEVIREKKDLGDLLGGLFGRK